MEETLSSVAVFRVSVSNFGAGYVTRCIGDSAGRSFLLFFIFLVYGSWCDLWRAFVLN